MRNDPSSQGPAVIPRLYGLLTPYRRSVLLGGMCLLIAVAAELYPPLVWQRVVDVGLARRDWGYIGWQLALLLLVFGVGQLFSALRGVLLERAGQRLVLDLRLRLYERLQRQSASYMTQQRTGDQLSVLTSDVESIQDVLIRGTDSVLGNGLRLLGVAAIFIALQPALGLLVLTPMVAVALLLRRYNRRVRPAYQGARQRLGDLSARFADNLGGLRVIQSFAQERRELAAAAGLGERLYQELASAVATRNRVFPAVRWVANLGNVFMLGGGIYFILRGQFTLGGLLAYRGYGRYFYGPIDDLVSINDLLQKAAAAGRRIFAVLDAPISIVDAPDSTPLPSPLRGELRVERLTFGYDPARPVLRELDLQVRPGERVALLGESGAGKSTLLALLARFYDPDQGRVLIDGHDLRQVTLESLRSQLGQVQQETYLFNSSVLDNIRYGRPEATQEEVEGAARAANAHGFIRELPQGYDTIVGERGVRLSGGQRQRIAVARAFLVSPRLLLLDEPTSALDPDSEALVIEAIGRLMQGRTTLIVSHRLSLARRADRVIVLEQGRIVEDGAPEELAARPDSRFAAMLRAETDLAR